MDEPSGTTAIGCTLDRMTTTDEPDRPLIRTQADLERTWRHLVEPRAAEGSLGRPSIWMMLIDADDRPFPHLVEVAECPVPPEPDDARGFAELADDLLDEHAPGGRWAMLLVRAGTSTVTANDRAWAHALLEACRAQGVATDVLHLATDGVVVPLPYDELALPA